MSKSVGIVAEYNPFHTGRGRCESGLWMRRDWLPEWDFPAGSFRFGSGR